MSGTKMAPECRPGRTAGRDGRRSDTTGTASPWWPGSRRSSRSVGRRSWSWTEYRSTVAAQVEGRLRSARLPAPCSEPWHPPIEQSFGASHVTRISWVWLFWRDGRGALSAPGQADRVTQSALRCPPGRLEGHRDLDRTLRGGLEVAWTRTAAPTTPPGHAPTASRHGKIAPGRLSRKPPRAV